MYRFLVGLFTGFVVFTDEGKKITNKAFEGISKTVKNSLSGVKEEEEKTETKEKEV